MFTIVTQQFMAVDHRTELLKRQGRKQCFYTDVYLSHIQFYTSTYSITTRKSVTMSNSGVALGKKDPQNVREAGCIRNSYRSIDERHVFVII